MSAPQPGDERTCLLVLRSTIEDGLPETLRVRLTVYRELGSGTGESSVFASVGAAAAAVADALASFAAGAVAGGGELA